MQRLQRGQRVRRILHDRALGHLQAQVARGHALGQQLGAHEGRQVLLHEVARGHVDIERHLQPARAPRRQLRQPARQHPARDRLDAARLLGERDPVIA